MGGSVEKKAKAKCHSQASNINLCNKIIIIVMATSLLRKRIERKRMLDTLFEQRFGKVWSFIQQFALSRDGAKKWKWYANSRGLWIILTQTFWCRMGPCWAWVAWKDFPLLFRIRLLLSGALKATWIILNANSTGIKIAFSVFLFRHEKKMAERKNRWKTLRNVGNNARPYNLYDLLINIKDYCLYRKSSL